MAEQQMAQNDSSSSELEYGPLDDETLNRLADDLFVTLDKEESANENSAQGGTP